MTELAECFYRLALSKAVERDLSDAIRLAGFACLLDESHENAARLLLLCLNESGDVYYDFADENKTELFPIKQTLLDSGAKSAQELIDKIHAQVQQKKWRKAVRLANDIPHRSVRVLNIQGCLYARAGKYRVAARCFAEALEKDRGNHLAAAGLAETARRR